MTQKKFNGIMSDARLKKVYESVVSGEMSLWEVVKRGEATNPQSLAGRLWRNFGLKEIRMWRDKNNLHKLNEKLGNRNNTLRKEAEEKNKETV